MFFNVTSLSIGFFAGFGTGFIAREIYAATASLLTPVTRRVAHAGTQAAQRGREVVAGIGESFEDLVSEVEAELSGKKLSQKKTVVGGPGPKPQKDPVHAHKRPKNQQGIEKGA